MPAGVFHRSLPPDETLSRKDWHAGAIGAVLSVNFGRQGRPEILPRRLHRRGGASVEKTGCSARELNAVGELPSPTSHSNRSPRTEISVAGKRNFQGRDKEAETALKIHGRRCRDKISLGNSANSGLIAGFREISVRTRMRGGGRSRSRTYAAGTARQVRVLRSCAGKCWLADSCGELPNSSGHNRRPTTIGNRSWWAAPDSSVASGGHPVARAPYGVGSLGHTLATILFLTALPFARLPS
jgi:hypothetical protein